MAKDEEKPEAEKKPAGKPGKKPEKGREREPGKPGKGRPERRLERVSAEMKARESKDFNGIVRLMGKDLNGHLEVKNALTKIKGIGHNLAASLATVIQKEAGIPLNELVGNLSDDQLDKIEEILKEPGKRGVQSFLLNRQRDPAAGEDKHLLMTDLVFAVRQDVEGEKAMRSWRGWRHSIGQKVRGQHTRTTGRKGLTVGVLKKKLKAQKRGEAAAAQAAKKEKK